MGLASRWVTAHLGDDPLAGLRMTTLELRHGPDSYGGSSGEYCTMGASLMQPCRVYEKGLRVVKYFQRGGRSKVNTFAH